MKTISISIVVLLLLSSCFRLDDNLYNLSEKITEYKLDKYTGEQDFILDDSYFIPDDLIHLFTLSSKSQEEVNPTTIYALYIGDLSRIKTDTVIMYCHGNKWHMDFYWQRVKLLAHTGSKNNFIANKSFLHLRPSALVLVRIFIISIINFTVFHSIKYCRC